MLPTFFVTYALLAVALATAPILVSECGTLEIPSATYQLAKDIAVNDPSEGYICFDIKGDGITLEGNGYGVSSAFDKLLPATGVRYSGVGTTVKNVRISNLRTGVRANGKFGKVHHNTITKAVNGIDVTATNNEISHNVIGDFNADESSSGIYVYFPAKSPVASFINITNNVISNIRGTSFVLGISVYYATAVTVEDNRIYNLVGDISSQEISVIQGFAEQKSNVFTPPIVVDSLPSTSLLLSCSVVLASAVWFFRGASTSTSTSTSTSVPPHVPLPSQEVQTRKTEERKEEDGERKEDEEGENEDGQSSVKPMTFSVGSSPNMFLVLKNSQM